jgi:TolB-like protein
MPQLVQAAPAESDIRAQLARILASQDFAAAEGARKLLSYVVTQALAGHADLLKEYTLATEVFGRDASFDPKINPAVRVEAGRLRRRLEHYYLTQGRGDPVLIELRRGGYAPRFSANADVLHLAEELAEAASQSGPGDDALPTIPGGPVVCVRPFENLGLPADGVFADGVSIEILTALSRFREIRVLGRGTVFGHRDEPDPQRLCTHLGANHVLTGTIRRDAEKVRVHAQLLSGAGGNVLWAERYERDLSAEAMFKVQDDIASHVVAAIAQPRGAIARPVTAEARQKPPERLHSYDCLMLFYDYTYHRSEDYHRRLRDLIEAEIKEAPGVATLWAALSMVYTDTWRFGYNVRTSRDDARDQALAAANRAVDLDPQDALGYHARFLAHFAFGDVKAFREAGNRALELNPNHSDILADYGVHLTMCDDWNRGRLLMKISLSLDPEPPDWFWFPYFAWHFERGEFDEALEYALRAPNPEFYWTHCMHVLAYAAMGMKSEAAEAMSRLLEMHPEFPGQAREELARWVGPDRIERVLAVLYAAGLPPERRAG